MIEIYYLAYVLTKAEIELKLRKMKPELAAKFSVSRIGYFGSFVTEQQTEASDLDLLVEFSAPIGWKFFTLERFLEQSFGLPIDLVTKDALHKNIKETVLNKVQYI
jgi:uncharacterized protein